MPLCQFGFKFTTPFSVAGIATMDPHVMGLRGIWFSFWLANKLQRRGESGLWIKEQLWGRLVKVSLPNCNFLLSNYHWSSSLPSVLCGNRTSFWKPSELLSMSGFYKMIEKAPRYLCSPWAVLLGQHNLSCSSWEHSHSGCLSSLFSERGN